jgi:LacI family transcriptional regulator
MRKDVNIFDIARLAGVSKSTVSRVLNGRDAVREETRARVRQAIDEYTYIPNNSARCLSALSTQTVVLLVHGITNPFFSRIISLILEKMYNRNFGVIVQSCELEFNTSMTDAAIGICKEKRPKGIILLGGFYEGNYQGLQTIGVPIVMASATINGVDDRSWFSSVTIDDEKEGSKIADFVCRNGHRKVAVIGQNNLREQGIVKTLGQYGVPYKTAELAYDRAYLYKTGYKAAMKLLEEKDYTCFLCLSDVLAIGAMKAVREKGLRVPKDISVVGFDGIENAAYTNPALTTFVQPFDEIADKGVSTLLGLINGNKPHKHIILHTTLEEGGSFARIPV